MSESEFFIEAQYTVDFREGLESGYDYFFRQYFGPLSFMANKLLRDQSAAEDMVQDCFLKLWQNRHKVADARQISGYLFTSVRNACIDQLRKMERRNRRRSDFAYFEMQQLIVKEEEWYIETETLRLLYQGIEQLPPRIRQVVDLYYLQGKSYQEISVIQHTSPETIRKQKARALAILKDLLSFLIIFLSMIPVFLPFVVLV